MVEQAARNRLPRIDEYLPDAAISAAKSTYIPQVFCQGVKEKIITCSALKGLSVKVLSSPLSATIVSTHRFGRKISRTILVMDLRDTLKE